MNLFRVFPYRNDKTEKFRNNMKITKIIAILAFTLILPAFIYAQNSGEKQSNKGEAVFKIPDDVFPRDWNEQGFKGILMLKKDAPAGLFVAYPNDDEHIEELKTRISKSITPMFVHDKDEESKVIFLKSLIPKHRDDFGSAGEYYSYTNAKSMIQILFYERAAGEKNFLYGYFAMKGKEQEGKSVKDLWADENGQGVKILEKFWKTFKD